MIARLKAAYQFLRRTEPALLQGFWKALIGIMIAAGVTVPDWLDARVSAVIVAVYVLMAAWQALATRARVVPVATVEAKVDARVHEITEGTAFPPS